MSFRLFMGVVFMATAAGASTVRELPWRSDIDLESLFSDGSVTHAVCISKGAGSLRVASLSFEKSIERNAWTGTSGSGRYRLWNLDKLFGGKEPAPTKVNGTGAGLLEQFLYTQKGEPVRLELGGLKPAESYRLVVFTQGWETAPNKRVQLVSSSTDPVKKVEGSTMKTIEPNRFGKRVGVLIVLDYVADQQGRFEISFDPLDDPMSLHLAAFANFKRN